MANNIGTLVIAPIRPQSSLDLYPVALTNEIKGGCHQVATIADRDAISVDRREVGMLCVVNDTNIIYQLVGGLDNSYWQKLGGSKVIPFFTPNTPYSFGSQVVYNNIIYIAKKTFESGAVFDPLDWEMLGGDMQKQVYDKDYDGIVDRAEFADVAQMALETTLIKSWQPNTDYTAGMQLVYLNQIYTVVSDFTSGATFDVTNLDLTATGHHNELWSIDGGDTALKEYYHLAKKNYDAAKNLTDDLGNGLRYNGKFVGDMLMSVYDVNKDGVVDEAGKLLGQTVTIADINMLYGIKGNVQSQINAISGMNFKGNVATFADIPTLLPVPLKGDTIIIEVDETKAGLRTFYTYNSGWVYLGPFTVSTRDFSINPLNINTETIDILDESKIDPKIARITDIQSHVNYNLLETYTQTEIDLADAVAKKHSHLNKAILDTYTNTNLDISDAVSKKHDHTNKTVLDLFSERADGMLLWKGSLIQGGGGSGGGITDLSMFTTADLADSTNRRYVTDSEKSNLALLTGVISDQTAMNNTLTAINTKIPADATSTNKLISTSTLTSKLSALKFINLADADPVMTPNSFVVTNATGTKVTYQSSIQSLIKIQKVTDKDGNIFTNVPFLNFTDMSGLLQVDGTLNLTREDMFSTMLKDMPAAYDTGKVLVSNASLMKYELKSVSDLTNSKENFSGTMDLSDWSQDTVVGDYTKLVVHGLNSKNLIVATYDSFDSVLGLKYSILDANQIILRSPAPIAGRVIINCSQGVAGSGTGTGGGGLSSITASDFIDDSRARLDKTYSSQKITGTLNSLAPKTSVYTKSESDSRYSLKGNEHTHANMLTLNKISENLNGDVFFNGKKLLTNIQAFFHEQHWTNEDHANLDVILTVMDIFASKNYAAILESEFTIKNTIPSVDEATDVANTLHLVVSDGTITVLDVNILPQESQKYLLGISPNLKIMAQGKFDANYYITAY